MSKLKLISLSLLVVFIVGCKPSGSSAQSNPPSQSTAATQTSALKDYDPLMQLEELTDVSAPNLLLNQGNKSFVVVYSSKETGQDEQLATVVRESHNYTGAVKFYRLDQAKNPTTWTNITSRPWKGGPCFILVNNAPVAIGTVMDTVGGVDVPVNTLSSARLNAEIVRFLKVQVPVTQVNVDNVDAVVAGPAIPTFVMAYRNKGPNNDPAEFQRFVYESQLYAGRVNFVIVDLDQDDISTKLGIKLPKQDDAYFIVYDPKARNGSMVYDPHLTTKGMEAAIRMYFGPGHEPATVIH